MSHYPCSPRPVRFTDILFERLPDPSLTDPTQMVRKGMRGS
jgi:hypothetical protein